MTRHRLFVALGFFTLVLAGTLPAVARKSQSLRPPHAKVVPKTLTAHGQERTDNFFWLNQREDPEVTAYLTAENAYTDAAMAHTKKLQERLFREFKTRIKQTDVSVPYKRDGYYYYARTVEGRNYPLYCRKPGTLDAAEEVMLDVNSVAKGHAYCSVGQRAISSAGDILAYPLDTVGRRFYTVHFRNLKTGEELPDRIPDVTSNVAWANDNKTLFYVKQHPTSLRAYQVYRHVLGTPATADALVYEEPDETFDISLWKTRSKQYVMIGSFQTLSSEIRYVDADTPAAGFKVFLPRQRDHEYEIEDSGDQFYVRTNYRAKNFRLMRTAADRTALDSWEEVIPHRDDVLIEDFEVFRDYLVVTEREGGLIRLRVRPWAGDGAHSIDFGEPAYLAYTTDNYDVDSPILRFGYTSLTTPTSIYDYNMATREKTLLKREEVLGGFDPANYVTDRLNATASDGTDIPISIVHRKGLSRDGSNPLLLYGYGSYGASTDASFRPYLISLLDRGFVYAIAHVRGGEELGRSWYEDGKLLKKKNTFTDFIQCAEFLVARGYTRPDRLFAHGGSAGGLLIGAVINMRPELFRGAIAAVPFVDVVTTMLDATIPLTTAEYDEWGNPNDRQYYDYMVSYSPYDNVVAKRYPNLLVTSGLHDSQVQYFEPAKWVAKLRALKTDDNLLLLRTKMEAGHGGASARYDRYRDTAFEYAFLLDLAGLATH